MCPTDLQLCVPLLQDYVDALAGVCYDGIEGLLFLGLFSLLAALTFSTMICAGPRAWKHFTTRWAAWRGCPGGRGAGGEALLCLSRELTTQEGQGQPRAQAFSPKGHLMCAEVSLRV